MAPAPLGDAGYDMCTSHGFFSLLGGWVPAPARGNPSQTLLITSAGAALHLREQRGEEFADAGGRGAGGVQHLPMVEWLLAQAGGRVRDQRDREYFRPEVARGDRFERGGHADKVGARGAQHPDLGGRLVVRAGKHGVHALGEGRVVPPRQVAQPSRVRLGEVGEPRRVPGGDRPGQRGAAGGVRGERRVRFRWSLISTGCPTAYAGLTPPAALVSTTVRQPAAIAVRTPCTTVCGAYPSYMCTRPRNSSIRWLPCFMSRPAGA